MKDNVKLKISIEYEANPEFYDTNDPRKMAEIDEDNFNEDPSSFIDFLTSYGPYIRVDPV